MSAFRFVSRVILEMAGNGLTVGKIHEISNTIEELKRKGQDTFDLSLQRSPFGFYCKEAARIVGNLKQEGGLESYDPVILNEVGYRLLEEWSRGFELSVDLSEPELDQEGLISIIEVLLLYAVTLQDDRDAAGSEVLKLRGKINNVRSVLEIILDDVTQLKLTDDEKTACLELLAICRQLPMNR